MQTQEDAVLGCKLSKSLSFSQDEELYIATSDTKIKMEEDYAPFVDKILNNIPYIPYSVLDLGCGPGYIARRISEVLPNAFVFGLDKSITMINHANKVFKKMLLASPFAEKACFSKRASGDMLRGETLPSPMSVKMLKMDYAIHSAYEINDTALKMLGNEAGYSDCYNYNRGLKYMIADSANLPFGKNSFNLIILKGTFKCLDDKLNSLKEMFRVLADNGDILIYEFRKEIPDDEFSMLTEHMNPQKVKSLKRKLNCSLDIEDYEKYLSKAGLTGFADIKTEGLDLRIRISKNC